MLRQLLSRVSRRPMTIATAAILFSTLVFGLLITPVRERSTQMLRKPWVTEFGIHRPMMHKSRFPSGRPYLNSNSDKKLHILLPATRSNVHMCKTLLTLSILEYPNPHIVSWGEQDDGNGLLGGGSHYAKITGVLKYINDEQRRKQPNFDNELVLMIDSYDIWFQLPVEVLTARYHAIVAEENTRTAHRMGRAFHRENIHSPVVFGAGKRCSPNQIHTLACYPIPDSPLPMDTYGGNTDTLMGRNMHSSFRTRYLNSGYMIGPIGAMRPILERARERMDECAARKGVWYDNGSGSSDNCYQGSDQSIFVEMFGEQEFHREVMRRHHRSVFDALLDGVIPGRAGSRPPETHIQNAPVEDYLNPRFSHQPNDQKYLGGKPFEFGITLDYWSLLGHQTSNAEFDSRYIKHDQPLKGQVGNQGMFDCPAKAPMPDDLPSQAPVLGLARGEQNRWESVPLYSEICSGTVPVMIHHNSVDKSWRERQWDKTWWHGSSRKMLDEKRKAGLPLLKDGVATDTGELLTWEALCPRDVEKELFRDVEDPPKQE